MTEKNYYVNFTYDCAQMDLENNLRFNSDSSKNIEQTILNMRNCLLKNASILEELLCKINLITDISTDDTKVIVSLTDPSDLLSSGIISEQTETETDSDSEANTTTSSDDFDQADRNKYVSYIKNKLIKDLNH